MKKRILSLMLVVALVLAMFPLTAQAYGSSISISEDNSWNVTLSSGGKLTWKDLGDTGTFRIKIDRGQVGGPLQLLVNNVPSNSFDLLNEFEQRKFETGRYGITIETTKNGSVISAGRISFTYISPLPRLSEPHNPHWNGSTAIWDAVPGAESYLISLYYCRADGGYGCAYSDRAVTSTRYDCGSISDGYWFEVKAAADGCRNSNKAESPKYENYGGRPVSFDLDYASSSWEFQMNASGVLSWKDLGDTGSFQLKINSGREGIAGVLVRLMTVNNRSFDFKAEFEAGKLETGTYFCTLQTTKNGSLVKSGEFKITYISQQSRLAEPHNLRWSGTRISWDPVNGASEYLVSLCRCYPSGGYGIVFSERSTGATSYDIGSSAGGEYWVEVRASADGHRSSNVAESTRRVFGQGWYIDDAGCLHITGNVTNPSTDDKDQTPWKDYKDQICSVVAEAGSSIDNGAFLFSACSVMTSADLKKLDTSRATSMAYMFSLTSLESLDLSSFKTANVTSMAAMFVLSPYLTKLDLSSFDTAKVTDMNGMFLFCSALTSLNVGNFRVSGSADTQNMFLGCMTLGEITIGAELISGTADQLLDIRNTWYNKATGVAYTTESALKAITGNVTLSALPFVDVKVGDFFYDPVLWAVESGITNGVDATHFGPGNDCLRAQVVTFLWRAAGEPEPKTTNNPFVDVKPTDFFYKPVLWAVEKGITSGMDATHFGPLEKCNRAQVVTFLYRAAGSPSVSGTNPFVDVPKGSFYEAPVLWAVSKSITNGMDTTHFGPNATCNRAQIVTFLYRAYK